MKLRLVHILLVFIAYTAHGQYYLRGEITDEKNQPLQNVKILLHSNHSLYYSGSSGSFGITTNLLYDTLTLSLEGYDSRTVRVNTEKWQTVILNILPSNVNRNRPKRISVTKDLKQTSRFQWYVNDETYSQLVENEYVNAGQFPNTGFSLNINKASYSNVRRFINMGSTVPPDAVRTEELLNYFNLHYREPGKDSVFHIESQLTSCPWDSLKQLLVLNINAKKIDLENTPPSNFVFLIDASGSMDQPNRLPLLKAAFQLFVNNLRVQDTVSIVAYGGTVSIILQPTSGAEKEKIIRSMEELTAGGDTPGEAAIMAAYQLASHSFIKGGNNRVILATDGNFNVGRSTEKDLEELITREKQTGIFLTCLGVGMGNFKDSKLEVLAKMGNGNFAYLDDIREAEKVLVKELTQTLYAVADDVYMNLQFNSDLVKEYRLIGFDNKKDAVSDSSIDLEGGEIGSGTSVMAIFEIVPVQPHISESDLIVGDIATVLLRYRVFDDYIQKRSSFNCPYNFIEFKNIDHEFQFGTALAMFGLKVKQSRFMKRADWQDIEAIATRTYDKNSFLQGEFLQMIGKAKNIYSPKKKKRRRY